MDRDIRNAIQRATQSARALLEREVGQQLEGIYDIDLDGTIAGDAGPHLDEPHRLIREKLVAAVNHHAALGRIRADAVGDFLREAAFTTLNRFVALKMLEARELVQQCVSRGDQSSGFREFAGLAPGLVQLPDQGYRLYLESLFDEIGQEVGILFDRRDPSSLIWPRRQALNELLEILNAQQLVTVWDDDETIGWVYQYFNSSDERKQMRDESQVPRNSRELAVRNQFFTPRYVVRFLVDNTLARIWSQMRGGETQLSEGCEFLVLDNAGESAREKKDPRDIKILDPACGSGHFLLYAFDVLQTVYEESWDDDASPASVDTGSTLRQDYADLGELHSAMPGMILGNNLFGVEIDPRAAQIAALALWLRAQRAYRQYQIPAGERPRITRTHIVVAEPMPGDRTLVETFAANLQPPLLGDLFKRMVSEMRLAGELGTLLKVDDAIATTLTQAREDYVRQATTRHLPGLEPERRQEELDFSEIDDVRFFEEAEAMLLDALHLFSESAAGGSGVRRWLFADDAAQGIALIELVKRRFDVILMNPPFGECTTLTAPLMRDAWGSCANDIYALFVLRSLELLADEGVLGAISSRGFLKGRDLRDFRPQILGEGLGWLEEFVDLGLGVLDNAEVETAMYVIRRSSFERGSIRFVDLRSVPRNSLDELSSVLVSSVVTHRPAHEFLRLPQAEILYTATDEEIDGIASGSSFDPDVARVTRGLNTSDDERFLRLFWEVPVADLGSRYRFCAKGGEYQWILPNIITVIDWLRDGDLVAAYTATKSDNVAQARRSSKYYYRPALTCTYRSNDFSLRALPAGAIFTNSAPTIIPHDAEMLVPLLASFLTERAESLLAQVEKKGKYDTGRLGRLPVPDLAFSEDMRSAWADLLAELSRWERRIEASPYFAGCDETATDGSAAPDAAVIEDALAKFGRTSGNVISSRFVKLGAESFARRFSGLSDRHALLSLGVGVAFGRLSAHVSVGPIDPFVPLVDELPSLSRARSDAGATRPTILEHRGTRITESPLLCAVRDGLAPVFGSQKGADDWLAGTFDEPELVAHFLRPGGFFDEHLRQYSGAFRRAPVYWQVGLEASEYALWLSYQELTDDTLFRAIGSFVKPALEQEERKLASITRDGGVQPDASARRRIATQSQVVGDLSVLEAELSLIAPLFRPNLHDGVLINSAVLWRLIPHSPWRNQVKKCWEMLCAGEYDWATIAIHLWPERVVPKCAMDRSLAIVHGLEDVFWEPAARGKAAPRKPPTQSVEALVAERTSAAVTAALTAFRLSSSKPLSRGVAKGAA